MTFWGVCRGLKPVSSVKEALHMPTLMLMLPLPLTLIPKLSLSLSSHNVCLPAPAGQKDLRPSYLRLLPSVAKLFELPPVGGRHRRPVAA